MQPDLPGTHKCRPGVSLRSRSLPLPASDRRGVLRLGSNLFQARRRTLRRNPARHAQDQELRPRMAPALQEVLPFSTERIPASTSVLASCSRRYLATAVSAGTSLVSPVCKAICPTLHASSADLSADSKLVSGACSALRNDSISSLDCRVPLSAAKSFRACANVAPLVAISPSYSTRRNRSSSGRSPTSAKSIRARYGAP